MTNKYKYEIKKINDSDQVITVHVEKSLFEEQKEEVFKSLAKNVKLKGFRPGMAPKNLLEASLGPELFEKTLDKLLPKLTVEIFNTEKINPITQVEYNILKVGGEEGVEYTVSYCVFPEVKLGKVSKIKIKKEETVVDTKEVDSVLGKMLEDTNKDKKEDDKLKQIDDAWVEKLGMQNIKTVSQIREEIEKTLKIQRQYQNQEKYEMSILDELIKISVVPVPQKIMDKEVENREKAYTQRIEKLGIKFDEFLKSQKTDLETLRKQWMEDAKKRIETEFVFAKIVNEQKLKVEDEEVENEIKNINDPKLKEEYDTTQGRFDIANIVLRQKALKWLIQEVEK